MVTPSKYGLFASGDPFPAGTFNGSGAPGAFGLKFFAFGAISEVMNKAACIGSILPTFSQSAGFAAKCLTINALSSCEIKKLAIWDPAGVFGIIEETRFSAVVSSSSVIPNLVVASLYILLTFFLISACPSYGSEIMTDSDPKTMIYDKNKKVYFRTSYIPSHTTEWKPRWRQI